MNRLSSTRNGTLKAKDLAFACTFAFFAGGGVAVGQQVYQPAPRQQTAPAPIVRQPPSASTQPQRGWSQPGNQGPPRSGYVRPVPGSAAAGNHQHLAEWMQSHSTLPLDQQQRALAAEPGFRQLRPEVQQRMHERLTQLNAMNPQQRQRTIERTEAMERLSPPQRQQVRSALSDLGALPQDRRRYVARTFRALRDLPDPQRQAYLNSPQMRAQFTENERVTLNNLFAAEPYMPVPPQPMQQAPR